MSGFLSPQEQADFDREEHEPLRLYKRDWARESRRKGSPHLRSRYGLEQEDYNRMFEKQRGCCAICGRHASEFPKRLHVDHNHETGKIRGLLCQGCNQSLRIFDLGLVQQALNYLREELDK